MFGQRGLMRLAGGSVRFVSKLPLSSSAAEPPTHYASNRIMEHLEQPLIVNDLLKHHRFSSDDLKKLENQASHRIAELYKRGASFRLMQFCSVMGCAGIGIFWFPDIVRSNALFWGCVVGLTAGYDSCAKIDSNLKLSETSRGLIRLRSPDN